MKKILIAEDEKDIVDVLKMGLELEGYEVIVAYDGEETLRKLKEEKPDLLLLDIMMPKVDGYSISVKMKEDEELKNIPIIVITGKGEMRKVFEETKNIDGYLEKPFPIEVLIKEVKRVLGEK